MFQTTSQISNCKSSTVHLRVVQENFKAYLEHTKDSAEIFHDSPPSTHSWILGPHDSPSPKWDDSSNPKIT